MMRFFLFLVLACFCVPLIAQSANQDPICENNACADAINNIRLDAPAQAGPSGYTAARTAEFKTAYQAFKKVKEGHSADSEWQGKYNRFELGGANCRRYYDLESRFAYEYEQNPSFKVFIDTQESDISAFQKAGFDSSRRGLNLETRFNRDCPKQQKDAEKAGLSSPEESREIYDKLGQTQGYWDDKGTTLKQLEAIPEKKEADKPKGRMSKKERVEQLTQKVADLPLGDDTKDKIEDLSRKLSDLAPQATNLTNQLDVLSSKVADLLPKPGGIIDKVGKLLGLKKPLSDYIPKISGTGILDKIKGFFGKGKKLKEKAAALKKKADQLNDDLTDTVGKAKETSDAIIDKGKDAQQLLEKLKELQAKKDELKEKLADKPKKILDELTDAVADVDHRSKDLLDKINKGAADSDKLKEELEKLKDRKKDLEDKIEDVGDEIKQLDQEEAALNEEAEKLDQAVEELKKQEDLKQQVEDLEPTAANAAQVAECEKELRQLLDKITGVEKKKERGKSRLGKILSFPGRLLGKVTGFIDKHAGLKAILGAIPGVSNLVNVVDGLFGKSKLLKGALELITGKQSKLMDTINGISQRVDTVKSDVEDKLTTVTGIKDKVTSFAKEKTDLLDVLGKKIDNLSPVEQQVIDLVKKHNLLGENSACNDLQPQKEEVEDIDEELDEVAPQITEIEEELEELEEEVDEIEKATEEVEGQVNEVVEQQEEVEEEEEAIKEEFGQEMELEPVTVEEWSESFEVTRPYWEATFHPDDEVVEGYRGRYFQVQLKDAEKTIKLLFGPGEYHMSKTDFRDNYGSVIGAFVTEALVAIRKNDRASVKLFVQGSADISGAASFRGDLDESYYYNEINLLPMKGSENFGGEEEGRTIPERRFTNEHLPNLRGQFMKEMISVYSKKLQPVLLEGSVKKKVDKEDRNAVIYLFLPEDILKE